MIKKLKNNKGADISLLGVIIILMVITAAGTFFDIFIASVAKEEAKQIIEFAELYSLVKGVDVHRLRDDELYIDVIEAKKFFDEQINKHTGVGPGSYYEKFEIKNVSYTYNSNKESFVDNVKRDYISCSVIAEYTTHQYFTRKKKAVKLKVDTRLLLFE